MATTSRAQPATPHTASKAALNTATLDALDAEKRRLDEVFAWFNGAIHPTPAQAPQVRAQHVLDTVFAGARLALEHTQERAQEVFEQQRRFEHLALSALGLSPDQVHAWHQQWLDHQQQTLAQSTGLAKRWWEQAREQALAVNKVKPSSIDA